MSEKNTEALFKAVVDNKLYLGTPKYKYFPKVTDKVMMGEKNGQIVINPNDIVSSLEKVKELVSSFKKDWKSVLVVFDKEVFKEDVEKICNSLWVMYLNSKVPSWFFTNFETFSQRISSMNKLREFINSEHFLKLTKKEQLMKKRELKKLEDIYRWVTKLSKKPDLVIIIDWEYYLNTAKELEKIWIDYVAVVNTDLSKLLNTDYLIVANTNSYESIIFLLNYILK